MTYEESFEKEELEEIEYVLVVEEEAEVSENQQENKTKKPSRQIAFATLVDIQLHEYRIYTPSFPDNKRYLLFQQLKLHCTH
jgi:hypothetical protein